MELSPLSRLINMNRKMVILVLLAGLTGSVLPGCGSQTAGVPESSKTDREKYKEMRLKSAEEATLAEE